MRRVEASRKGGRMRRITAMVAGLTLAGALAGAPAAAEGIEGNALIQEVAGSVVVLDGEPYQVGASTRLEDEQGGELTLPELPSLAGGASGDEAAAWFMADEAQAGGLRELRHLRLTGAMPK